MASTGGKEAFGEGRRSRSSDLRLRCGDGGDCGEYDFLFGAFDALVPCRGGDGAARRCGSSRLSTYLGCRELSSTTRSRRSLFSSSFCLAVDLGDFLTADLSMPLFSGGDL